MPTGRREETRECTTYTYTPGSQPCCARCGAGSLPAPSPPDLAVVSAQAHLSCTQGTVRAAQTDLGLRGLSWSFLAPASGFPCL